MKKKLLSIVAVAAVAVAAAWGFNQSNNEVALTDVTLSNVEALAGGESGGTCYYNYGAADCNDVEGDLYCACI
ncbi:NVEALA domain-containing protein [Massilibacteroides vaginae]|uniref:NVEALA domain-containing protein n=1 Tax=Massilibacteroides vaginae TaxID=1673718 RepID=UPI000A1CDE8C|nr:NVEALA domain-containing protein [Massilibacteroides vaginae]